MWQASVDAQGDGFRMVCARDRTATVARAGVLESPLST